jgi:hypothetical protein
VRPSEKRARPVITGSEAAPGEALNLLGDFSALLQQVGSPIGSVVSSAHLTGIHAGGFPSRQKFLESYLGEILLPLELPAIVEGCGHAMRGEWRELIAQDHRLEAALSQTPFAAPSRQAGRRQLSRMRPLRDDRMVQRYLAAVESGQAHGWHTVVYGLTLAVYSLPLAQGLLFYAQETLAGLAVGAGNVREESPAALPEDLMARVLAAVSANLAGKAAPDIRLV